MRQPPGVPVVGARAAWSTPRCSGPPDVRADVVAWLRRDRSSRGVGMRRSAEERLQRLLVMLPWLMERGEVPLAEVAQRFRLTPEEVAADLELAAMCGLPPFVDEMIDLFIDDDVVVVGVPRLFTRPLRLTAPEGFALVAAGRAAMQLPGADAARPARPRAAEAVGGARRRRRRRRPAAASRGRRAHRCADGGHPNRRAAGRALLDGVARRGHRAHDHPAARRARPGRVVRRRRRRRSGERRTFRVDRFESLAAHRRARRGGGRRDRARRSSGSPTAACRRSCCGWPRRRRGWSSATRSIDVVELDDGASRRRFPWPANAGWSACCCGWGTRPRCSRRSSGGPARGEVAQRVLARYGE